MSTCLIEWGGLEDCAQTRRAGPTGTSPLPPNHSASAAVQYLVETDLRNWSVVLELHQRCATVAGDAKDAAHRLEKYFSARDAPTLLPASRLWLILLCYQPPYAAVTTTTTTTSSSSSSPRASQSKFVQECNKKDFLSAVVKLVGDKATRVEVVWRIVRIVATAASRFGGEFERVRPGVEGKSPERVILLFQPTDEIFYPTTGFADRTRRGRREGGASSGGNPALVIQDSGDYVLVERDRRAVSQEPRTTGSLDAAWRLELAVARETGEMVFKALQRMNAPGVGELPFDFVQDLIRQCETWKRRLSSYQGAEPADIGVSQSREFKEAVKALDDALEYNARLQRGPPSGERHMRTASTPSSPTNPRPSPSLNIPSPSSQQPQASKERRPSHGIGWLPGGSRSEHGHGERRTDSRTTSPWGYQSPPSPPSGYLDARHGATSLDGHGYRGGHPSSSQAPDTGSRPQPATWSKGQAYRR